MLKVGLIGVGGISGAHIPAWNEMEDASLVALCDRNTAAMEGYRDTCRLYTTLEEMLEKEELDILDICLPTHLHIDTAIRAMERGVHVLCEKPLTLNEEDVRRVYQVAEDNGVCFMVAHVLRFWPAYERLKELYDEGTYGHLLTGSMCRLSQSPRWSGDGWRQDERRSGLMPFDLHIHDLDFMIYAFGEPVEATHCRSRQPGQDAMTATYRYDGFYIQTEAAFYAANYPFKAAFRFQFEQAVVEWEGDRMMAYPVEGEPVVLLEPAEQRTAVINLSDILPYAREIRYFTDCVKAGVPADRIRPEELLTVLRLLKDI
ncbi:MAG: Gfo/Idh/MocA family oxidoreductase [Ruminococcaceae bacterium]|nr:Gfo/Idh/MocA family oxidoreductase [Oscillospiraceae bacterium]